MTTEEFGKGYALLLANWRQQLKDLSEDERVEQRNLYYQMLKDMDGTLWQEVVGVAIRSSTWFPRVAELVTYANDVLGLLPGSHGADAAFEAALRAVRRLDPLHHRPMLEVRSDVDRTVRSLGGWGRLALVEDEQLGWYRKEFIAAWEGANGLRDRLGHAVGGGAHVPVGVGPGAGPGLQPALEAGNHRPPGLSGSRETVSGEGVLDAVARSLEESDAYQNTVRESE